MSTRQRITRFVRLATAAILLVILIFGVGVPILISYVYVDALVARDCGNHPTPIPNRPEAPPTLTTAAQSIVIRPPQADFALEGWFIPGENDATVIVLPGAWGGRDTMYQEVIMLHEAGYNVLTYDTRSCAMPPQNTTLGYAEVADLQAALNWLIKEAQINPNRIGVFGHSMGGATAIMTAAQDERIAAIIATGNYADLAHDIRRNPDNQSLLERFIRGNIEFIFEQRTGIRIEDARPIAVINQISPRPLFLIHGGNELDETRGEAQFRAAQNPKDLWIVPDVGHGGYANEWEAYQSRSVAFFDAALLGN